MPPTVRSGAAGAPFAGRRKSKQPGVSGRKASWTPLLWWWKQRLSRGRSARASATPTALVGTFVLPSIDGSSRSSDTIQPAPGRPPASSLAAVRSSAR